MMSVAQAIETAVQHHQAGNLPQAEQLYRQILQADPQNADALHLLGVIACQVGRSDVGVDYIRQALRFRPDFPRAVSNLGNALRDLGKLDEAASSYRETLRLQPNFA